MRYKTIQLIIITFILFTSHVIFAQNEKVTITGQIVEDINKTPLPFVTVIIKKSESNEILTGGTTDDYGKFGIQVQGVDVDIEIGFMGYETVIITRKNLGNDDHDLGIIKLKKDNLVLEEVELRAEKSSTEFKLDRRVFNV